MPRKGPDPLEPNNSDENLKNYREVKADDSAEQLDSLELITTEQLLADPFDEYQRALSEIDSYPAFSVLGYAKEMYEREPDVDVVKDYLKRTFAENIDIDYAVSAIREGIDLERAVILYELIKEGMNFYDVEHYVWSIVGNPRDLYDHFSACFKSGMDVFYAKYAYEYGADIDKCKKVFKLKSFSNISRRDLYELIKLPGSGDEIYGFFSLFLKNGGKFELAKSLYEGQALDKIVKKLGMEEDYEDLKAVFMDRKFKKSMLKIAAIVGDNKGILQFLRYLRYEMSLHAADFNELEFFLNDPSIKVCAQVYEKMDFEALELGRRLPYKSIEVEKIIASLIIGRSLYFDGISRKRAEKLTENEITSKQKELKELLSEFSDAFVFNNRTVVLAHEDEYFGMEKLRESILNSMPMVNGKKDLKFLKPSKGSYIDGKTDSLEKKAEFLNMVRNTPPPATFVFDGHGGPHNFYLSNGEIGEDGLPEKKDAFKRISDVELAEAIRDRVKKFSAKGGQKELTRDVYYFSSCFSHDYIRSILAMNEGIIPPIFMGTSEYGQVAIGNKNIERNAIFLVAGAGKKAPKISDVYLNQFKFGLGDFTMYLSNKKFIPQQVVKVGLEGGSKG